MSLLPANFDRQGFLEHYWQQRPCLISNANTHLADWLSADELAGLACEPDMESRLILTETNTQPWQVKNGPFSETDFLSLGEQPFNLLVQAVDHCIPTLRKIWAEFDFLPHWRIDDVMVNASSDGASVGAHFDYYDVFLIQGSGQKRWFTGGHCDSQTALDTASGLKLLKQFEARHEWLLNPGDILYVPAGIAHHGVAVGDSITYSLGFRAPSHADMIMGVAEQIAEQLSDEKRYRDFAPALPVHPAEIPENAITSLQTVLSALANNPQAIRQWFGQNMTSPRDEILDETDEDGLDRIEAALYGTSPDTQRLKLWRRPGARFAYAIEGDNLFLFADGNTLQMDGVHLPLVQSLCDSDWAEPVADDWIEASRHNLKLKQITRSLCQIGTLYLDEPECNQ